VSLDELVESEDPIDNGLQIALAKSAANEGHRCFELREIAARQRDVVSFDASCCPR
jgi:hypothetical protein